MFGPVLLTGLYCVVAHVVSPRSTHACRTQSPLVARLAGNTLLLRKEISFRSVRLANTKPTAVAAGHSRQRAGIRARRPSESSLDLRCQLLPGCNPPALPCFPQALQQEDRARPNRSDEAVGMYTIESRASPRNLGGEGLAPLRVPLPS